MEQVNAAREDRKARAGGEDLGTLSNAFIYYLFLKTFLDGLLITVTFSIRVGSPGNLCVSVWDYYCYKFQMRPGIFNPILFGKRLFQQFVVDTYVKIESSRLDYIRNNQDSIRAGSCR